MTEKAIFIIPSQKSTERKDVDVKNCEEGIALATSDEQFLTDALCSPLISDEIVKVAKTENYHFIGIGGIGMSGLARLLLKDNSEVTGSDIAKSLVVEELMGLGAAIQIGHKKENIPSGAKVVFTSDIKSDNPEYKAAISMGCKMMHRSDLLAELIHEKKSLAVAGTHGKTTTSSLLATVLLEAGLDPSFAVGGILPAYKTNAKHGKGEYFPFEADESDGSFLKYHPFGAIVTNIDRDHLNCYSDNFSLLIDAFKIFMGQVQSEKHLFWCRDDEYLANLHPLGPSYGFHNESDWRITSFTQNGLRIYFDVEHKGETYSQIELSLSGHHNVLNGAAVFGLAHTLGVDEASIRCAFRSFLGVLRRCESKGEINGIQFIDDYAHHPTEIKTTLEGIRKAVPARRLVAIFQPHRYSRTKDCLGTFASVFDSADALFITEIYGAGESEIPGISHNLIVQEIAGGSNIALKYVPRALLSSVLQEFLLPGDVVVTLGAGDITKLSKETIECIDLLGSSHVLQ